MHRGYRFKLYPTADQAETLGRWVGVTRLVYNLALEQRRDFWRQFQAIEGRRLNSVHQSKEVTDLRREFDFIRDMPRVCQEQALRDLDKAFAAFFAGRSGFPSWRKAGVDDTIRFQAQNAPMQRLNDKWSVLRLPGLPRLKFRSSRATDGEVVSVTVSREGDGWSISVSTLVTQATPPNDLPAVGIDRGVATTLSLSNGEHINLPSLSALEKRRRRAQRTLSRRRKGSRRYAAQRSALARISAKLGRVRLHHLHIASTQVVSRFGVVAIERLNVKGMTASAKGTVAEPGKNVRQKAGLNRSILAQGWSTFARQLEYKLEAAGGRLVYVPAAYTSQTCAECGVVDARSRKSQAVFECVACDHRDHADTNAARNIMRGSTAFVEGRHQAPVEARTLAA